MKVIKDTREKQGWHFVSTEKCEGTITQTLKTGDYTIEGLEDKLCIERKGAVSEFAQNLMDERFYREMERAAEYPHSYIILEFTLYDLINYPRTAHIPLKVKNKIRINGKFLVYKMCELQNNYPVKIIFAGAEGQEMAYMIMRSIYVKYRSNPKDG